VLFITVCWEQIVRMANWGNFLNFDAKKEKNVKNSFLNELSCFFGRKILLRRNV
jgi:hypothetical protein